jgi:spermidine synthase
MESQMIGKPSKVAGFLFCSGLTALIYQTIWSRQFRLIFGASTYATAAVLAIFMGGLGVGSLLLGKRADGKARPLEFYGNLEILIATMAALSQPLLALAGRIYVASGGSAVLGLGGASVVRLVLAAFVIGVPTFLMGGTLPAAARAIETGDDVRRRRVAVLYAANTVGAVAGALLSTFWLVETFGNRKTLIMAALVNLLVGVVARAAARGETPPEEPVVRTRTRGAGPPIQPRFVFAAAAVTGFAFLLMEMVWYRMLTPLLGGTTFMFGLVLATALLGIGAGGSAYSFWRSDRPVSALAFALTCALEAAAMALPFALGDRLAVFANFLQPLGRIGFGGHVLSWSMVTLITVFPAAFVSGIQFPLLVGLLGSGRDEVGRDVGAAYACNTVGAIAGSLAGGFGLMQVLSAPGCWRLVIVLLAALAIGTVVLVVKDRRRVAATAAAGFAAAAILAAFAVGPTAVWRHSAIGAGHGPNVQSLNGLREWERMTRRTLLWDADGRESAIALRNDQDLSFFVNGKSDGAAVGDAGTQVMAGLVGAALHVEPRSALVIGLGTGSTAGWLGAVDSIESVDVVELEPVVLRIAAACRAVNHDVLNNPKIRVHIGDARETLLASRNRYDLIFSEPSNPYRAGVASLFTREFYDAAAARLNPGGLFLQWVQAYEIDADTLRTVYATIGSTFPYTETWWTSGADLLLLASRDPVMHDVDVLRRRLASEPLASAMHNAWRTETAEGFLSHFVASAAVTAALSSTAAGLNTDDQTLIEFGFARALGDKSPMRISQLLTFAQRSGGNRPSPVRGEVDWNSVALELSTESPVASGIPLLNPEQRLHCDFDAARRAGNEDLAVQLWDRHRWQPVNTRELSGIAEVLAAAGRDEAVTWIDALARSQPSEAAAILARLRIRQGRFEEAALQLQDALTRYRGTPWPLQEVMRRGIRSAAILAERDRALAQRMAAALGEPFAARQNDQGRAIERIHAAYCAGGCAPETIAALKAIEPHVPWQRDLLLLRRECYGKAGLAPLAAAAQNDIELFTMAEASTLSQ